MDINKDTRVSDILKEYGDIADVMEVLGVKRVGRYSLRRIITKLIKVKHAAFVHRVPPDDFLQMLHKAVKLKDNEDI